MIEIVTIPTTWGVIRLTLDGEQVVGCALPFLKTTPSKPFAIEKLQGLEDLVKKFPRFGTSEGTDFQQAVWSELKKIPSGQTRTYSEIAKAVGRPSAVRAVGTACGANPVPLFIPCHRVVAKNGLGGFGACLPWKTLLLNQEDANKPYE